MYALPFSLYSYSLYEPKDIVLSEYKGGLEKAILKNSTLLVQLNDAFCKTHPWLAQKVCTGSAHAAVSKVSADCPNNSSHNGLVLHRLFHVALFLAALCGYSVYCVTYSNTEHTSTRSRQPTEGLARRTTA